MEKFKHIIIINVNNKCFKPEEYRFSDKYLSMAVCRLKNCVIPSLNNQIDKDFIIVLLFDKKFMLDKKYFSKLDEFLDLQKLLINDKYTIPLILSSDTVLSKTGNYVGFKSDFDLRTIISENDYIILSRIDYDDFPFQLATLQIKNNCTSNFKRMSIEGPDYFLTGFDWHFLMKFDKEQIDRNTEKFIFSEKQNLLNKCSQFNFFDITKNIYNENSIAPSKGSCIFSSMLLTICINKKFAEIQFPILFNMIRHGSVESLNDKSLHSLLNKPITESRIIHNSFFPAGIHSIYSDQSSADTRNNKNNNNHITKQ